MAAIELDPVFIRALRLLSSKSKVLHSIFLNLHIPSKAPFSEAFLRFVDNSYELGPDSVCCPI
jgi:hypothetical protein